MLLHTKSRIYGIFPGLPSKLAHQVKLVDLCRTLLSAATLEPRIATGTSRGVSFRILRSKTRVSNFFTAEQLTYDASS